MWRTRVKAGRRSKRDMEKLKSSFRKLRGAISSIKPSAHPVCIQFLSKSTQFLREEEEEEEEEDDDHQNDKLPCLEEEEAAAAAEEFDLPSAEQVLERVSSSRFFFSPRTTKSIMEEAKAPPSAERTVSISSAITILSEDPFSDFQASMAEMVAAQQLKEWHSLQDLLCFYLRLNEKQNHHVIVLAFADLLMHLTDRSG